jgi:hypothetical protein
MMVRVRLPPMTKATVAVVVFVLVLVLVFALDPPTVLLSVCSPPSAPAISACPHGIAPWPFDAGDHGPLTGG